MATISKRGERWFAQVRRLGHPHLYGTFDTKRAALTWAGEQEARMDRGGPVLEWRALKRTTLRCILNRYLADVTSKKRSEETERLRLGKLMRQPMCDLPLEKLTPETLAAYRDHRLALAKPGTVRRELSLIHHALEVARREWGLGLGTNPVSLVRQPVVRDARNRRLREGEWERLVAALADCRNQAVRPVIELAVHTGLRRSEILGLEWRHINWSERTAHVPLSKNGHPRTIPLTELALAILKDLRGSGDGMVFGMSANALRLAWERTKRRAGIAGLRFHDLRHEAISRFAEMGLNLPELQLISGHKDVRMLLRYTHIQPTSLALKLASLGA